MDDPIGKTRISMRNGVTYLVLEDFETVKTKMGEAFGFGTFAEFTSVSGQSAIPPERLMVFASHVCTFQECSLEGWVWQQRASELHYARQLEEQTGADKMVAALKQMHGGDEQ